MSVRDVLFIDANQYLDLYRLPEGKKLLTQLHQRQGHIFVTEQVVDEVNRNKVKITAAFLAQQLERLELNSIALPIHLLGNSDDRITLMRGQLEKICRSVKETREEFKKLTLDALERVSQSKDDVSKVLDDIFSKAVQPNDGEIERARARKERGNPPGKRDDPLGDELSWEQLLSHCKDKPRLWIITRDFGFGTVYADKMFLNAALYQELARLYQSEPTVFCFHKLDGISRFALMTGAKPEDLPTPEETERIKKEQELLHSRDWLGGYDDAFQIPIRVQDALRMMDSVILTAALASQLNSDEVIPPPATEQTDKDQT